MTVLRIVEDCQSVFPKVGETQILQEISNAHKRLSEEARVLEAFGALSSHTTTTGWTLPSDFVSLVDILLYDSDNDALTLGDFNYNYEITNGKLYIFSKTSTPITGLDASIAYAYMHYIKQADTITSLTDTLDYNTEYIDAIREYVLYQLASKYPIPQIINGNVVEAIDLRLAGYHERQYNQSRIRLKKQRFKRDEKAGGATYYPHAGSFILPRRKRDTVSSTVTIGAIASMYTKYARWTLTYPSTVTVAVTPTGYSGTVTASIASNQLTISSTASDFGNIAGFYCNNSEVNINSFGSTSWVFDLPSGGWGTIRFEIFE